MDCKGSLVALKTSLKSGEIDEHLIQLLKMKSKFLSDVSPFDRWRYQRVFQSLDPDASSPVEPENLLRYKTPT